MNNLDRLEQTLRTKEILILEEIINSSIDYDTESELFEKSNKNKNKIVSFMDIYSEEEYNIKDSYNKNQNEEN